ncbi:hypothetical protein Tco_0333198 [Tanacetum coccineum]
MVAFLNKSEGSEDLHQIIDFLTISDIKDLVLTAHELSRSRITSSTPSLPPLNNTSIELGQFEHSIIDGSFIHISKKVEDLQNDLKKTKVTYGDAYTKLILEGTSWIQEDAEIQTRTSADTEILLDQEEPTELVEDFGSGEKGEKEISTANISVSTAIDACQEEKKILVYIRRSAEKRKDKGKAIMKEDESVQKKTKKQLEQERLSHEAAIRLQEQVNEEERQRIARDAEIAKQFQEEIEQQRQEQRS